jgi:pyruvate/2-oxoglutarate dehydrogenase complex dihydrolipoamide dehydrogenase (E3) component
MVTREVDVVVVGLGPGGEAAATQLAEAGLDVVGVERRLVGGECPYYGCVPSKMILRAAGALAESRRVPDLAGGATTDPDWAVVAKRIRAEATADWDDRAAVERLERAGVQFVRGQARLAGDRTVEVSPSTGSGGTTYTARRGVLLNTGTEPAVPPVDGLDGTPYWTNRDAVRAETMPATLVVVGGGAIGVELAQGLARFGAQVTIIESTDRILAVEEPEASEAVARALAAEGVQLLTSSQAEAVSYDDGRFQVRVGEQTLHADKLLIATGRRPNLADIGLETVGLDPDAPALGTDDRMRAGDGLWAVGDITGKGMFTHMSMYQAAVATADILGNDGPAADYRAVPRVTFTDPEVGSVGRTEKQAREHGVTVSIGTSEPGARGWIADAPEQVKLVADADRGVLVGATAVGPMGGEVLSMLTTAVHAEVPVETLRSMIYAYPTFHRAVETAVKNLG